MKTETCKTMSRDVSRQDTYLETITASCTTGGVLT